MFMPTMMGMVRPTTFAPALGDPLHGLELVVDSGPARPSWAVSTFQLSGRCPRERHLGHEVDVGLVEAVEAAVAGELQRGAFVLWRPPRRAGAPPRCSPTATATGSPAPSEWVRARVVLNPSPPASIASWRSASISASCSSVASPVGGGLAHDMAADGAVAHQERRVDGEVAVEPVEILAVAGPVPRHPLLERSERHPLDLLHHASQVVDVLGMDRRQGEPAVAGDDAGHAVEVRRRRPGVPEQLGVVVGVGIDETGAHDHPLGVDGLGCVLGDVTDLDDAAVAHSDIGSTAGSSRAVDHRSTTNDEIQHDVNSENLTDRQITGCGRSGPTRLDQTQRPPAASAEPSADDDH